MPKEFSRTRRVGEQMQRELAQLIQQELKDPRIGLLTVIAVEVSKDFSHAKVFVTSLNNDEGMQQTLQILEHAKGFLKRELGRRIKLRIIPDLHFVHDESIERGNRLSSLIDKAIASDKKDD
ncbi:MAG: 30S ribosome-binding factor RbfA [Gammaproteobacteria bacterium]|nr:30S ribosome-binding factor RbfA [Gammaproteobacteria bacterium]